MTDAEYWKRCALWLASVHGANAEHAASLKATSKSERLRQEGIAARAADMIRGIWPSDARPCANAEWVIDRLERAKDALRPGETP